MAPDASLHEALRAVLRGVCRQAGAADAAVVFGSGDAQLVVATAAYAGPRPDDHELPLSIDGAAIGCLRLRARHGEASAALADAAAVLSALLASHARERQLSAVVERERFRSLDRMQLRGRVEPVHVYLLEAQRNPGDTAATAFGDMAPAAEPEGIRLVWLNMNRVYSGTSLPVVLGRSPGVTYCIDDTRVSRSHARIDWHGGTFQLTDLSYNGTYVRFDHDPEVISLRRGTCTLHGSGLIGLGTPPTEADGPCVRFEVMKFADTQPHDLYL